LNEVEQFVDTLFTGLDGFVYGAQKHPMKKDWLQRFFVWPDERDNIIEWVIQYHKILDIYLAPSVFKSKHATKDAWKDTNFVFHPHLYWYKVPHSEISMPTGEFREVWIAKQLKVTIDGSVIFWMAQIRLGGIVRRSYAHRIRSTINPTN
jgi:hypothetical protein